MGFCDRPDDRNRRLSSFSGKKIFDVAPETNYFRRTQPWIGQMLNDLLLCHAKPQTFLDGHCITFNLRRPIDVVKFMIPQILSFGVLAQMRQFMREIHVEIQWLPIAIVTFEESDERRFWIFNIDVTKTFALHDIHTSGIKQ